MFLLNLIIKIYKIMIKFFTAVTDPVPTAAVAE